MYVIVLGFFVVVVVDTMIPCDLFRRSHCYFTHSLFLLCLFLSGFSKEPPFPHSPVRLPLPTIPLYPVPSSSITTVVLRQSLSFWPRSHCQVSSIVLALGLQACSTIPNSV